MPGRSKIVSLATSPDKPESTARAVALIHKHRMAELYAAQGRRVKRRDVGLSVAPRVSARYLRGHDPPGKRGGITLAFGRRASQCRAEGRSATFKPCGSFPRVGSFQ